VDVGTFKVFVFDLDGTVYLGDSLLPGAQELISDLRTQGRTVRFLSNNPTRDPEQYARKLTAMGIPAVAGDVVTSGSAMAEWLAVHEPGAVAYPIGEEALVRQLEARGVPLSDDPAEVDIVVASYDRGFSYHKLQIAFDALWFHGRARLFATNPDRYCPLPGGRGEPDSAAMIAAVEACTGVTCERVVGKPDPAILYAAIADVGVEPENCLVIGDRLTTDTQLARNTGAGSALVLTGDATREDLAGVADDARPDHIIDTLDDLRAAVNV